MLGDVRYAWRAIARMPVVAAVVVASIGVGIGVNTAVFSWVQSLVLRPLPGVAHSGGLFLIEPLADTGSYPGVSWREYGDLRERLRAFPDPIAFRMAPLTVGAPGQVQRAYGLLVSGNYFSALGLRAALGRLIRADEVARPGGEPVLVVGYDYWQTRLGGDPAIVGRTMRVNDRVLTVIGVAPPRFHSLRGYAMLGRLADGVSRNAAQAELDAAMRDLARLYPETNGRVRAEALPFWQAPRGPQRMLAGALALLQAIMLLLLLAVCGNTANLLLARAAARQREIGIRLAVGAGRSRIIRLLLVESLLVALPGALVGVAMAAWATDALRAVPIIGGFPIRFQTELDAVSVGFAALLGVVCGVLFGAGPALQLARVDPIAAIRSGTHAAGRSALRHVLMAIEVGLALVVLLAAAMFVRTFNDAHDTNPGFRREGVLLANYDMTGRSVDASGARDFARRLLARLRAVPAIESAAIASAVPLDIHGLPLRSIAVEGRARSDAAPDRALTNTVTPGYFRTMGIAFAAGRDFVDLDDAAATPQAIVNEEFVRRFVGEGEAIGRRIESRGASYTIAGIVRNSVSEALGEPPTPVIYLSYRD
ncbi:MAG: hypothetical protein DMF93_24965, partial [Acidobacteria bacterium]